MRKIGVLGLILFSCFISVNPLYGQENSTKGILSMGRATDNVIIQQKKIEPIIDYLASRLEDIGVERGEVVLAGDNKISTLIRLVKEGEIDIILESPFIATVLKVEAKAIPILIAWRKGVREYNSLIFVRKDSGIKRIEDLKGRIIAFEDPGSNSGYFLPKIAMKSKGLELVELSSFNSIVPDGKTGYVFAGSELNISSWVFYKKVAAGAVSNLDWITPQDVPEAYKNEFKIIYESQKMPEFIVLVRKGLDRKLVKRVKEEFLRMDKSEKGRKALRPYGFDRFVVPESWDFMMTLEEQIRVSGERSN
ncbi:MAG: phosphate/phosphite/phosphonate ABC transporter substrate-binding protein [Nitrospirae bacterium]|nr:phosphate/phosphite/phosphonate ABC transporter substrate-binding protein [Nitrospirota bacterium]